MTEPRRLGDRYELGEVLGYGGMAEVLHGRDLRLGRDVAVKTLRVDLAREPSFQSRFRREAQSAASLNHPAIVAVYDTGESMLDGVAVPYIVMEYVDGRTLRDVLKTDRYIMPTRALEITADVLKALDYSHRNGIIHRDIKPGNVMLTRHGDVKVMDFGIARALAASTATVTQTAAVIGTAQYLSPEQARGEPVDPRSDVYSTGCLLYELLTGAPPFTGDSAVSVAYQHVREDPQPPSRLNPDVSPAIDAIVLKAMAKNPANRYQSAAEMREDIGRALSGVPVQATPVLADQTMQLSAVEGEHVAQRQPRGRRPLVYLLLFVVVVAVLVGVGLLLRNLLTADQTATDLKVPTLRGLTETVAVDTLKHDGFQPEIKNGPSDKYPAGQVYQVSPPEGTSMQKGATVTIWISTGPQDVTVPSLKNKSLTDAQQELERENLKLGQTKQQNSQSPPGTVLDQDPQAGTPVKPGSPVNLVVASGTGTVPDVRHLPVAEAQDTLTQNGYSYAVTERPSDTEPAGNVIQQYPTGGSPAKVGSTVVQLYVSTGAPTPSATPTPSAPSSQNPSPPASPPGSSKPKPKETPTSGG